MTEDDIKLLESARLTDTPDGGGAMTGRVIQSGADNNLFDDVNDLERVMGATSLRKLFLGVQTNTTEKYMGARLVIDQPPADPYIDALLFGASSLFDQRAAAKARVEAYLALGSPYQGLLYGPHIAGMAAVTLIQRVDQALPAVGQVLVLKKNIGLSNETEQYIRVSGVTSVVTTFTDTTGDFSRLLVTCNLADQLRYDFPGFEATRYDTGLDYTGRTRVYQTVEANAADYYGIKPLATAATLGSYSIRATSAFAQLVPSAQTETPIADARTNNLTATPVPTGGLVVIQSLAPTPGQATFIGGAVAPGDFSMVGGGVTVTDSAGVLMAGSVEVGAIDYENGILTAAVDAFGGRIPVTITCRLANVPNVVNATMGAFVTPEGRSLSYVTTLPSAAAPGSLKFEYMSGGQWYTLRDGGNGLLRGAESGHGAGVYNSATRTVTITMGALPDVGSALLLAWVESARITTADNVTLMAGGRMFAPLNTDGLTSMARGSKGLPPGGTTLAWDHGGAKAATDNGLGVITGDAVGTVDYQAGLILWSPNAMPPKGTVVTISGNKFQSTTTALAATGLGSNAITFSAGGPVQPHSVAAVLPVAYRGAGGSAATVVEGIGPQAGEVGLINTDYTTLVIKDDGAGGLRATGGAWAGSAELTSWSTLVGAVDYASGAMSITLDAADVPPVGNVVRVHDAADPNSSAGFKRTCRIRYAAVDFFTVLNPNSANTVQVTYATAPATADPISVTVNDFFTAVDYMPPGSTLGPVNFVLGADRYVSTPAGQLQCNLSPSTGVGTAVGSVVSAAGLVMLGTWVAGTSPVVTDFRAALLPATSGSNAAWGGCRVLFRTATAPLRPGSVQVLGTMDDGTDISVTADANGIINSARIKGRVSYEFGIGELVFCSPAATALGTLDLSSWGIPAIGTVNLDVVRQETLRYNAVAYSYLPLNADVTGVDAVRLPTDGRVPIYKAGRVVLVHNTQTLPPQMVSTGQTVDCGRTLLARIRVFGADGLQISTGFTKSLDAGTLTLTNVAGMSQPVSIEHRIEDEALCVDAQITGDMRLSRPLTHNYPAGTSYVSSALIAGTLQAAAGDVFAQQAWTDEWSDSRIGPPILAQYNDVAHPIVVTNAGAIPERWAIIFQTDTTFVLVGEEVGQIITGDTASVLAPVNPATGVPYFVLQPAGWGSGWVAGNVLRYPTRGPVFPAWAARCTRQSPAAPPGTDQITITARGSIDQ